MINNYQLKFGRQLGQQPETIVTTPITVFVGPNNSGKSKVLREIEKYCREGRRDAQTVILQNISFKGLSPQDALKAFAPLVQMPRPNEGLSEGSVIVGARGQRHNVPRVELLNFMENPHINVNAFCSWFLSFSTLMLDGTSRIGHVAAQAAGDLQSPPENSLQVLFRDDARRHEMRRIIYDAFEAYFVVDPTNLGSLRIRLSNRAPTSDLEERGIHDEARLFHSKAQLIDLSSDGVKAFTGIMTEIIAGDPRVVLIDEPEAFLHPSLAFKLGKEVAHAAVRADKRVFASTHSPAFVMGCLQSGAPVNIVRLTYRAGIPTARVLPSNEILQLMRNPLLRSTGVISGLFYEFVVVTESDADRAFYQEVNERLIRSKPDGGIPNCLFINAQNKQTVHTIIQPLRKLGIPAVGVVDVDVLKEGGTNWTNFLNGGGLPPLSHNSLATLRAAIKGAMDATGKDMKRDGGLSILPAADKAATEGLLSQLAEYGLFVVPGGELESWLKSLSAPGHGPSWLIEMFQRMGEDPAANGYLMPTNDDVWGFVSRIKAWLTDPKRKGIPG
jgi:ABC-type cobalamin/Fe3+-siderophores transport system ATPase subunit